MQKKSGGSEEDSQEIDYRLGSELFAKYMCALRDADIGSIDERGAFEAFILEQNFGDDEVIDVPTVLPAIRNMS